MVRPSFHALLNLLLISPELSAAVPANTSALTSTQILHLFHNRQNSCPSAAPVSCASVDSKLPGDFCCQTGSYCISLDSSSSALCCPNGQSCSSIQPVDCNVSLQDPSKNSYEPLFTTRLGDTLAQCGSKCCPFGYTCSRSSNGSAVCQLVANKAITQQPTQSTTSVTPTPTPNLRLTSTASISSTTSTSSTSSATSTSSSVPPASSSSIDSTGKPPAQSGNPFPPTVFLAGFFPGMLVGALGVLAWVILTGRHKKSDDNRSATSSIYRKKRYISGPIMANPPSARTDFLRKGHARSKSGRSIFSKRSDDQGTPGLPFDNWKMPTPPEPSNVPDQPMGRLVPAGPGARSMPEGSDYLSRANYPVTPQRQIYGEESRSGTETIRVYSPKDMEYPSAAVAPLRGMNSRDRPKSPMTGSPFITPDQTISARPPPQVNRTPNYPYESTYETLTPARYQGSAVQKRPRPENAGQESRPETTFTAMLEAINFPDPMNRPAPTVPGVPHHYRR